MQVSIYSTRKSKSQKKGPSGAPGPISASPWRAKEKNLLEKKSHDAEKMKGGTLWDFSTSILSRKTAKNLKGGPLGKQVSEKMSRSAEKKLKWGLARYGMLREKTGKAFLVQFARPNGAI